MQINAMRALYDPLRSLAFGSISGTYAGVGSVFSNPVRIIKIWNNTNADLIISFDGVTDRDFIPAGAGQVIDYASNKSNQAGIMEQPAQERVYVKQASSAATSGSIYVTIIYASTQ